MSRYLLQKGEGGYHDNRYRSSYKRREAEILAGGGIGMEGEWIKAYKANLEMSSFQESVR